MIMHYPPRSAVTLNSFQGPSLRKPGGSDQGTTRAERWMLKQVQHDGRQEGRVPNPNGFSLVELMVVLFILALLTTVVAINVLPAGDKAQVVTTQANIKELSGQLEMYRLDQGTYPGMGEGLAALKNPPANLALPQNYRAGGYVKDLPNDPWGHPFQYQIPGRNGAAFEIFSLGADGKPGGEDNDADIYADKR